MPLFQIPVVFTIDAESLEEAQNSVEEWGQETEMENLPSGTEDCDYAPTCEHTEDSRILYLPNNENASEEDSDLDSPDDDFNDSDGVF